MRRFLFEESEPSLHSAIQILQMKETSNPFSLAVFNDMLYWSDAKRRAVQATHKITGKNHLVLLKRPQQPFGIKARKNIPIRRDVELICM